MVAPRSLPDLSSLRTKRRGRPAEAVDGLALRWAQLCNDGDPRASAYLATLLRKLAVVLTSEPFWPLAARPIGAELLLSLLGRVTEPPGQDAADVVVSSLRLLRGEGANALGVPGPEGERRLAAAIDEVVAGVVGALQDRCPDRCADPRVAAALEPGFEERLLPAVYEQAPLGIAIATLDGRVLGLNPALRRMLGLETLDQPRPVSDFVHPDDMGDLVSRLRTLGGGEQSVACMRLRLLRVDSRVLWVHVTAWRVLDELGRPSHVMGAVEDASDRHRLWSRLRQASFHDQLTRLPNQAVADQWLHRAFADGGQVRVGICTLSLDLVHDELGARIGNRLLLGVAGRLQLTAGDHLVCRTGADEFTALVADPVSVSDVCRLADRFQDALATPFVIEGNSLVVTASIGVAETATAASSAAELLRAGEVARSWARALGGARRVVFDPERDAAESARFALLQGLRGAIERGEFRLAFQPLMNLRDRRLHGAEALVRWQHPEQGLIGPGRFIELAEQSGAIIPLGRWVLEAACTQGARWWREIGPGAPFVSVNVSPVQMAEPGWVDEVIGVLKGTGLPSHQLQLEITEQAVFGDEVAALGALAELRGAGVRLALDDFGTGYSSLAWLRRLPVHALKIDGSFVEGLGCASADLTDSSIVRALVELAHALGLEVTAEWVETDVQARRLAALGCDVGQGRWFGDPGPGEWVPELWRRTIGT